MDKSVKTTFLTIMILTLLLSAGCVAKNSDTNSDLANLQQTRIAVEKYYTNGQYLNDVTNIAEEGRAYIESELASGKYSKPAVVFDIDDTLINNHQIFMDMQYCFSSRAWQRWINTAKIPAIDPMLELYKNIVDDVDVFIITGRNILQKSQTIRNLKEDGYDKWTNLFFKQKWDVELTAREYKSRIIELLVEDDGYQIIANFGDQESDFGNPLPGKNFKLPNYLYITQ